MEISVTLGDFDFDLELDITTYPSYRAATRNHPEEGEDAEYDIESVDHGVNLTGRQWRYLDNEEKRWYSELVSKSYTLKHDGPEWEDHEKIIEAINEELKLEAKYSMEP